MATAANSVMTQLIQDGDQRLDGSSRTVGTYVAEPKTAGRSLAGFNRTGQKVLAVGDRRQGSFRLREVQRFGTTKGDVMGQQSIWPWPERTDTQHGWSGSTSGPSNTGAALRWRLTR